MPETDALAGFFLSLDERPGDWVILQALADWYEEQGLPENARCLRWTADRALHPFRYRRDGGLTVSGASWHDGWFWWALDDRDSGAEWGHPLHCRLPRGVWKHLRRTFDHAESVFKEYPTQRAAYDALLEAWPLVGPLGAALRETRP